MGVMWVEVAKRAYDEQVESYLGLPLKSTSAFFLLPPSTISLTVS